MEGGLIRRPDGLHGAHAFAEQRPACPRIGAVIGDLLAQPANPNSEQKPAAREHVETGDFLGQHDRIALNDQTDPRAELDPAGHSRGSAQRDERVERVPVFARQITAAGPR